METLEDEEQVWRSGDLENGPLIWSMEALENTASFPTFHSRFSVTLLHVAFCWCSTVGKDFNKPAAI